MAGANIFLSLDFLLPLGNMEFLSPDSKCLALMAAQMVMGGGKALGLSFSSYSRKR